MSKEAQIEQPAAAQSSRIPKITPSTRARMPAVIAAMLGGRTLGEAAEFVGISRKTLGRMRQLPEFRQLYQDAEVEFLRAATGVLHTNAVGFVRVLMEVAADKEARPNDRVQAASAGLTVLLKAKEVLDLAQRIRELQRLVWEGQR